MLSLALATAGIVFLGAQPPAPSFAEAWYREVLEGNVAAAAKAYETLYLAQPSEKTPPHAQQRAAFRAGLCFERLGLLQSARPAYAVALRAPLPSHGSPQRDTGAEVLASRLADGMARESTLRLRGLGLESGTSSAEAGTVVVTLDVAVDVAIQAAIDGLRAAERVRATAVASLEAALAARRQKVADRRDLAARLAGRGVIISFAASAALSGVAEDGATAALKDALPVEADLRRVQGALRDRLIDRTLEAIRSDDDVRASSGIRLLSALSTPGPGTASPGMVDPPLRVAELKAMADRAAQPGTEPTSWAAQAAQRRILDIEIERRTLACREIRLRLDEALEAETRGRKDHALPSLDRVRELLDWSGPALRDDPEVSSLAKLAASRYLLLAKGRDQADTLVRLWSQARSQTDKMVRLAEDLLDIASEEARLRGPTGVGGRPDAADICRGEARNLFFVAEAAWKSSAAKVPSPDALAASFAAERALRDGLLILDWVPAADAGSSLRVAMEALLKEAVAASAGSQAIKKQDTKSP